MAPTKTHLRGMLLGVAYGDSWGYPNENLTYGRLTLENLRGPDQPQRLIVSDDTQMTLHLTQELSTAKPTRQDTQDAVLRAWKNWLYDPEMRGYGKTTIKALRQLDYGYPWEEAAVANSDACGAVMRITPCAFLPDPIWRPAAAWQAATTHGGATAIATATLATALLRDPDTDDLLGQAIELVHDTGLADAASEWLTNKPDKYIHNGMKNLRESLLRAHKAVPQFLDRPWSADPSLPRNGGLGWLAADALSCALLCVDMLPDDPQMALRRAAVTGGDSDTIAAVTGMFLGRRHGDIWPTEWADRLEPRYLDWINQLAP